MGYSLIVPNGIVSMSNVDFKCPKCECVHTEEDYFDKMIKAKYGLLYKNCKGCKTKLGITTAITGDVVVWIKSEEQKL